MTSLTTYRGRPLGDIEAATIEKAGTDLANGAMLLVILRRVTDSKYHFTAHIAYDKGGEIALYGITRPLIASGFVGTARGSEGFTGTISRGGRAVHHEVKYVLARILGIDADSISNVSILD